FGICALIGAVSIGFVIAQWVISERLYSLQKGRDAALTNSLNLTQEMATRLSNAHRATLNSLLATDAEELNDALRKRKENLDAYSHLILAQNTGASPELSQDKARIITLFRRYSESSQETLDLLLAGRKQEALAQRISEVRPSFDHWQKAQEQFGISLNTLDDQQRAQYVRTISTTRRLLLTLLVIPTLLVFSGVMAIVAIIGWQHWGGAALDPMDIWSR
ncbi:MAG: hypothetical protein ACOYMS_06120, partial [Terrimicrobiaceae bacterium]